MTEALKPCPFCGGEAETDHLQPYWHYATGVARYQSAIYCHGCTVNMTLCHDDHRDVDPDDLMAELVAAWNRRAALAAHEQGSGKEA